MIGAVAVLVVAAMAYFGWQWLDQTAEAPSPEVLAEQALGGSSPEAREKAAVQLATQVTDSRNLLRQVFHQSEAPPVRAACISGMAGNWDYHSMDDLLAALEDESPLVRGRAGAAVQQMLGIHFYFRAQDPPDKRAVAVKKMRAAWEYMRTSGKLEEWNERRNSMN